MSPPQKLTSDDVATWSLKLHASFTRGTDTSPQCEKVSVLEKILPVYMKPFSESNMNQYCILLNINITQSNSTIHKEVPKARQTRFYFLGEMKLKSKDVLLHAQLTRPFHETRTRKLDYCFGSDIQNLNENFYHQLETEFQRIFIHWVIRRPMPCQLKILVLTLPLICFWLT